MATTFLKAKNLALSTLAAGISDTDTSLTVKAGEGAKFPSIFPFPIVISSEILLCTARTNDVMTVSRAQEDTSAAAHNANMTVELNITAKYITDLNDAVNTLEGAGGGQAFPVGSVFLAVVNTDPATLLGYGTWSQIAQGQFLVGQKATDADFDTTEETGGEKTHTLTTSEIPSHSHILGELRSATTGSEASYIARTADTSSTRGTDKTTEVTGSGSAHNNLPPYFVVYVWKRTA